jgi:hypothetical protein
MKPMLAWMGINLDASLKGGALACYAENNAPA